LVVFWLIDKHAISGVKECWFCSTQYRDPISTIWYYLLACYETRIEWELFPSQFLTLIPVIFSEIYINKRCKKLYAFLISSQKVAVNNFTLLKRISISLIIILRRLTIDNSIHRWSRPSKKVVIPLCNNKSKISKFKIKNITQI